MTHITCRKAEMGDIVSLSSAIILHYAHKLGIIDKIAGQPCDQTKLEGIVRATVHDWKLPLSSVELEPTINTALNYARYNHPHAPLDFQVLVALYTTCIVSCDDALVTPFERQTFVEQLYAGQPQWHPLLSRLFKVATELRKHFPAYGGNAICSGTVEYLNAMNFASIDGVHGTKDQSDSARSIDYLRLKDGVCEPYALFVWPQTLCPDFHKVFRAIPDAMSFLATTNDLLSFYKEETGGEIDNYVHQYARAHGKSIPEALRCIADAAIGYNNEVQRLLGDGPERDAWDTFMLGYIRFHIFSSRYKLEKVVPEFFSSPQL